VSWVFENTGVHNGEFNMQYDLSLSQSLIDGKGYPTIRVYGWNPPAISLGYNQIAYEIDFIKAKSDNIDVVRRPTGGKAILHWNELTYSVTMFTQGRSTLATYKFISGALLEAFKYLGLKVSLEKGKTISSLKVYEPSRAVCFSRTSFYEIMFDNKKITGSAQRRFATSNGKEVVLQHGSIPLTPDYMKLIDYLNVQQEEKREELRELLLNKSIDLSTALDREVSFEEVAEAILYGFEKAWSVKLDVKEYNEIKR